MLLKSSLVALLGVSYATKSLKDHVDDRRDRATETRPTNKPKKEREENPKVISGWTPNWGSTSWDGNSNRVRSFDCEANAFYDQNLYGDYDFSSWSGEGLRPWFASCGKRFKLFHPEVVKAYGGEDADLESCFYTENYGERFLNNFWVDTNGYAALMREKFFNDYDDYIENNGNQNGLDSRPTSCKSMHDSDMMVFSVYCKDDYPNNRWSDYDGMTQYNELFRDYDYFEDNGWTSDQARVTHLDPNFNEVNRRPNSPSAAVNNGDLSNDPELTTTINNHIRTATGKTDFELTYAIIIEWSRYVSITTCPDNEEDLEGSGYYYYYGCNGDSTFHNNRFTMFLVTDDDLTSGCGLKQFKHAVYIYDINEDASQREYLPESLDFIGITANDQIVAEFTEDNWSSANNHEYSQEVFDLDLTLSSEAISNNEEYSGDGWLMHPGVTCGIHSNGTDIERIVGGENARSGQFRWQAYYVPCSWEGISLSCSICGATVISNRWLVSAAHCTEGSSKSDSRLYLGSIFRNEGDRYYIDEQIVHEDYVSASTGHDISLLRTTEDIVFNEYVHPACLPAEDTCLMEGSQTYVSGFGTIEYQGNVADQLMYVDVPIVSISDCAGSYGSVNTDTDDKVCAGPVAGGKDSCQGDSGGPLAYRKDGIWYLYGVVSYGHECAVAGYPGVYARTSSYNDWIFSNTNDEIVAHSSLKTNACDGSCSCQDDGTTTTDYNPFGTEIIPRCEQPRQACKNGGTCVNSEDNLSYHCECVNDYFGYHCENAPPCAADPCENGASCHNVVSQRAKFYLGYRCECVGNFHGTRCEKPDPCDSSPCQNNGRCFSWNTNWRTTWPRDLEHWCWCERGWMGRECEIEIDLVRWPFMGDVHYMTFDGQAFANQGWCSYVLTTNGHMCNEAKPSDLAHSNYNYYRTPDTERDFFMVIVDQEPLDSDPTYQIPVSVLNGIDIIIRPKQHQSSLYKFSASKSFGAGAGVRFYKSDGLLDGNGDLTWEDLNADARFVGNYNAVAQNAAIRVDGIGETQVIHFYIGCGQSQFDDAENWHLKSTVVTYDCLMKITYNPMAGTMAAETTNAMSPSGDRKLCGMLGNFDGTPDFDNDSFVDNDDKLDYQMDQEIANYFNGDKKCGYVSDDTVKAGIPIPIDSGTYFHTISRRKRDTESMDEDACLGDWNTVRTKCGIIYDDSRFGSCGLDKSTYFDGCVFDGCSAPSNLDNFVCDMVASFVASCNNAAANLGYSIISWRESSSFSYTYEGNTLTFPDLCPLTCGANQVFHSCAKPECFPTTQNCDVDTDACLASTECVEGCFCSAGWLQDGASCSQTCAETNIQEMEDEIAASDPCASGPCQNGATCANSGDDYVCTCQSPSYTGKDCDESTNVPVDAPIDVLNAILNQNAPSRKKRSLGADFLAHGCFCSKLDGSTGPGGKPISDYDKICKDNMVCTRCTASSCSVEERYPYILSLDSNGDYQCDSSINQALPNGSCKQHACECDLFHMNRLAQHQTDTGDAVTTGSAGACVANPPGSGGNTIACCGQDWTYKLYNVADRQCINIAGNNVVAPL